MKDQDFSARNLSMLIDFYELTMANGYFQSDKRDTVAVFDSLCPYLHGAAPIASAD